MIRFAAVSLLVLSACTSASSQLDRTYAANTNLYIALIDFAGSSPHGWSGTPAEAGDDAYTMEDFERLFGEGTEGFGPTDDHTVADDEELPNLYGTSVQSLCRRLRELTARRSGWLSPEMLVGRLNRLLAGWTNYFILGQVSPAYAAVDRHGTRRLRQWLCRKHKVRTGNHVRFSDERLWHDCGLTRLVPRTTGFPWAKA